MFFRRTFTSDPIPHSSTNPSATELNDHTTQNGNHISGSELQEDVPLNPSGQESKVDSVRSSGARGTVDPLSKVLLLKGKVAINLFGDSSRYQESSEEAIYPDLPSNDNIYPRLYDHFREGHPTEDSGSSKGDQSASTTVSDKDQRKVLLGPILRRTSNSTAENRKLLLEPVLKRTSNSSPVEDDSITLIADEPKSVKDSKPRTRRSNSSFPSFLQNLITPAAESSISTDSPSEATTTEPSNSPLRSASLFLSPITLEDDDEEKTRRRRKRSKDTFPRLHPVAESSTLDSDSVSISSKASGSSFGPSMLMSTSPFARKMEEVGRLRRLQSQGILAPDISHPLPSRPSEDDQKINEQEMPTLPTSNSYSDLPDLISQHDIHNQKSNKEELSEEDHSNNREKRTSGSDSESDLPELISQSDLNDQKAKDDEQQALHDALGQALREVEEAREEQARLIAEHNKEKWRLAQELKSSNDQIAELELDNGIMKQKVNALQSQLSKSEAELKALKKDKKSWQEQLDTMHNRVVLADKQIRCLDSLSRSKLEARMEGAFGPTRRSTKASTKDPSAEVVGAVVALNDEILQSANLLVENLERTKLGVSQADVIRAKTVAGSNMTSMLQTEGRNPTAGFRFLLMQATLEAFMVHWCLNIIEGWYPQQQTFADLLVDLASQATTSNSSVVVNSRIECGKVKILDTTSSAMVKFPDWVSDILKDLSRVILVAGLRMRPNQTALFTSKFLILVKMAYNVRTALAEKDICGGLEASVVGPDMPFQPKWMEEAHAASRAKPSAKLEIEIVANTSSIGLQRLVTDSQSRSQKLVPNMVLKPKVVLVHVLEESP